MKSCLIVLLAFAFALMAPPAHAEGLDAKILEPPVPIPDFSWQDADGYTHKLSSLRGDVVVLNLWATWCAPCVMELPTFDRLEHRYHAAGLTMLTVSVADRPDKIHKFFIEHGIRNLDALYDRDDKLVDFFKVRSLPTTFVFDRAGRMVAAKQGAADWFGDDARRLIEHELRKGYAPPKSEQHTFQQDTLEK